VWSERLTGVSSRPVSSARPRTVVVAGIHKGSPEVNPGPTAWLNPRKRAVAQYEERFGEPAPEGFRTLHVHDMRHPVGRRLRAAGVSLETRQAILGHKSGSITTHYSAAELCELVDTMEFIATDNVRESHALTLLKRKAS
jgi:integrase